jgi:hypothetical protein
LDLNTSITTLLLVVAPKLTDGAALHIPLNVQKKTLSESVALADDTDVNDPQVCPPVLLIAIVAPPVLQ